jgi:hypothetical protein
VKHAGCRLTFIGIGVLSEDQFKSALRTASCSRSSLRAHVWNTTANGLPTVTDLWDPNRSLPGSLGTLGLQSLHSDTEKFSAGWFQSLLKNALLSLNLS